MCRKTEPILVLVRDKQDPFLSEILRECANVKVCYCPSPLFESYPPNSFDKLERLLLVSDCMFAGPAARVARQVWPTSRWLDALAGTPPPPIPEFAEAPSTEEMTPAPGTVMFVPLNETHVRMLHPVAKSFPDRQFVVFNDDEHAQEYLTTLGEPCVNLGIVTDPGLIAVPDSLRVVGKLLGPLKKRVRDVLQRKPKPLGVLSRLNPRPSIIVLGHDWGYNAQCLVEEAKESGIPTICLQEGPLDFELETGPLAHAQYVFLQGIIHAEYMPRNEFLVTGNPRVEIVETPPLPEKPKVMVNANFTYNIFEDARDMWMQGVAEACESVGVEYFVSKHPRDFGDYSKYLVIKSDAFKIQEQIAMASLLITRFSTVAYECASRGRQVIYYNPHGEVKRVLTEDRSGGILHAATPEELAERLREAMSPDPKREAIVQDFVTLHCGIQDGLAVSRCVQGIAAVSRGLC